MRKLSVRPGEPYPLGATCDGEGVNFALFSEHATSVELLLFDSPGSVRARHTIRLRERNAYVWHCYIPGIRPPQLYAYRVFGPYDPGKGHRFNPNKILLDPYTKAICGAYQWDDALFGYELGNPDKDLVPDIRDSTPFVPKCVVTDSRFDWEGDRHPRTPWNETVIYETHLKGLTARHPDVPQEKRGTYDGLASPAMIEYLKDLGITAVELLPIHQHVVDKRLAEKGLNNYWGYNTIGFFAPDCRYAATGMRGEQVAEFKRMVKALHAAGIEVILDVVYNHTAEGNHLGPTLCFRGIDNAGYYQLDPTDPSRYMDFSGCGAALRMAHPRVTQLIMDSLRYWVREMHVDGFRFDLAPALGREEMTADSNAACFDIIQQDPVISRVKLIAEPWDLGPDGYQAGNFSPLWAEWNGKFRDWSRRFWKGDRGQMGELGCRIGGSSDLYQYNDRSQNASVNFVTCHDGFTLADLVSYNQKHNEANGEGNRDGSDYNDSWNCGVEGHTDDPEVLSLRRRQKLNFLATLFLSQGVPMLLGGDELSRTQGGNNNAYCQDNETGWHDWELDEEKHLMHRFTRGLIALRRKHPVFRKRKFFTGGTHGGAGAQDIAWLRPDGREMGERDWNNPRRGAIAVLLCGEAVDEVDRGGLPVMDDSFLLLINAQEKPVAFHLPSSERSYELLLSTVEPAMHDRRPVGSRRFSLAPRSLALLIHRRGRV